jgi:hypothetical protein
MNAFFGKESKNTENCYGPEALLLHLNMNIREQLLQEHSKANTIQIQQWIAKDANRFKELMHLFLHDEYRVVQRAAWGVGLYGSSNPQMLQPYLGQMIARSQEPNIHPAVKRNVTRILQSLDIPKKHHEAVINLCFDLLINPKEPIAIRCFSMTVLAKLCEEYPDIKNELKEVIKNALEYEDTSAGFKARSKKVLKELQNKKTD